MGERRMSKEDYISIGKYFKEFLDNEDCRVIRFMPIESWSANPKTKKQTRCKILLPKEICNTNLRDLDNWFLSIVAIPRKLIEELEEKEKQENGKEN